MPSGDWIGGRYVRVYVGALRRDHPAVVNEPRLLGWYVLLLDAAAGVWPDPAPWPRHLPADVEEALLLAEVIVAKDEGYMVRGMDHLRGYLINRGTKGGRVRGATGPRDHRGRYATVDGTVVDDGGAHGGHPRSNGGEPTVGGTVDHRGDAGTTSQPPSPPNKESIRGGSTSPFGPRTTPSPPSPGGAAGSPPGPPPTRPSVVSFPECTDPDSHEPGWVTIPGVGVKCPTCDRRRDSRTFSERARGHGAEV